MKQRLERFPRPERLQALENEIRAVQHNSFDQYIQQLTFPGRRPQPPIQASRISDKIAWIAIDGRERFEREKQRDLKRLIAMYRETKHLLQAAQFCIAQLPKQEAALIKRHCMDGESIAVIAKAIGLSRATAYRTYDNAVEHFTMFYQDAMARQVQKSE
ncbi:MAG: sigma factor-like helix-turn-helix DNA-binding protein [Clostridia bacterium]|nr:sigma factor-like helix-turn-helix DNA-binding protein [Clostridia bacterium]